MVLDMETHINVRWVLFLHRTKPFAWMVLERVGCFLILVHLDVNTSGDYSLLQGFFS